MSNLQLVIHDIKGIKNGIIEVPIENGVYALVGNNGVGKSTIMSCCNGGGNLIKICI